MFLTKAQQAAAFGDSTFIESKTISKNAEDALKEKNKTTERRAKEMKISLERKRGRRMSPFLSGHEDKIVAIAINSKGLCLSAAHDATLRLWKLPEKLTAGGNSRLSTPSLPCNTFSFAPTFQPRPKTGDIQKCGGILLRTFRGHSKPVTTCCFNNEGDRALSGSRDNTLRYWDVKSGKTLAIMEMTTWVQGCALSHDGYYALSCSVASKIQLWELETFQLLMTIPSIRSESAMKSRLHIGAINCCQLSKDFIAITGSNDTTLKVWNMKVPNIGECKATLSGHKGPVVDCLFIDEEKGIVASCSWDSTVRIWNIKNENGLCMKVLQSHKSAVLSLAVNANRTKLLSTGKDHTARIYDILIVEAAICTKVLPGHRGSVSACSFDPITGFAVTAGNDFLIRIWDSSTTDDLFEEEGEIKTLVKSMSSNSKNNQSLQGHQHFVPNHLRF
eukprot:g2870.t1